jgi:hypothetical protein
MQINGLLKNEAFLKTNKREENAFNLKMLFQMTPIINKRKITKTKIF